MSDAGTNAKSPYAQTMQDLTSFQRDLLFVVAGLDRPSGQEVKAELEDTTCETILPGQLYPNLDELCEEGLLRKEDRDGRTNQYILTERGRGAIMEVCRWQRAHVEPNAI